MARRVTLLQREATPLHPLEHGLGALLLEIPRPEGTDHARPVETSCLFEIPDHAGPEQHDGLCRRPGQCFGVDPPRPVTLRQLKLLFSPDLHLLAPREENLDPIPPGVRHGGVAGGPQDVGGVHVTDQLPPGFSAGPEDRHHPIDVLPRTPDQRHPPCLPEPLDEARFQIGFRRIRCLAPPESRPLHQ